MMKINLNCMTLFVCCVTSFIFCASSLAVDQRTFAAGPGVTDEATSDVTWSIVQSPRKVGAASHLYGVSAFSSDEAWAAGDRLEGEGSPLVYRWNGARWKSVSTPPIEDSYLKDIVAISSADVWAVGYQEGDCYQVFTVTEHWNGAA